MEVVLRKRKFIVIIITLNKVIIQDFKRRMIYKLFDTNILLRFTCYKRPSFLKNVISKSNSLLRFRLCKHLKAISFKLNAGDVCQVLLKDILFQQPLAKILCVEFMSLLCFPMKFYNMTGFLYAESNNVLFSFVFF